MAYCTSIFIRSVTFSSLFRFVFVILLSVRLFVIYIRLCIHIQISTWATMHCFRATKLPLYSRVCMPCRAVYTRIICIYYALHVHAGRRRCFWQTSFSSTRTDRVSVRREHVVSPHMMPQVKTSIFLNPVCYEVVCVCVCVC